MTVGNDPPNDQDQTEYNTGDITVSDNSEFVGRDQVYGDQYNVGRDLYQTEPDYEQDTTPLGAQLLNSVVGLLQLVGGDTLTALYDRIESLPIWHVFMVYIAAVFSFSVIDLLQVVQLGVYYTVLVLPAVVLMLPLLFTMAYETHRCPECGPFTLRRVRKSIVDTSRFRVFFRCTECDDTFDEEMRTTERRTEG